MLAITTGLRRGELLGLRWEDADLERGTLRVGRALVREGGRHTLGETKTRRGRRRVNLTPRTVAVLKAHRKRQLEQRVEYAGMYEDHGLIFSSEIGTPLNPETLVKRSFKPLLKRAGLPKIRFHDLRHTCTTLLMGRSSQARAGASWACHHSNDPGYLLALSPLDGRSGVRGYGRRAGMNAGCSTVAVKSPDLSLGTLLRYCVFRIDKRDQRVEPRGIEPLTSALPARRSPG